MMARNPDPSEQPLPAPVQAAARAAVSPSALVLAGTGALIGLVAGGVAPAVILGACCWAGACRRPPPPGPPAAGAGPSGPK